MYAKCLKTCGFRALLVYKHAKSPKNIQPKCRKIFGHITENYCDFLNKGIYYKYDRRQEAQL